MWTLSGTNLQKLSTSLQVYLCFFLSLHMAFGWQGHALLADSMHSNESGTGIVIAHQVTTYSDVSVMEKVVGHS